MTILNEDIIYTETKETSLSSIKDLNCWHFNLTDVSILTGMLQLERVSLPMNQLTTLKHFAPLLNLRELHMSSNQIPNLSELCYIKHLPLQILSLSGNPCCTRAGPKYRSMVLYQLPYLRYFDDQPVTEVEQQRALAGEIYDEVSTVLSPSHRHQRTTTTTTTTITTTTAVRQGGDGDDDLKKSQHAAGEHKANVSSSASGTNTAVSSDSSHSQLSSVESNKDIFETQVSKVPTSTIEMPPPATVNTAPMRLAPRKYFTAPQCTCHTRNTVKTCRSHAAIVKSFQEQKNAYPNTAAPAPAAAPAAATAATAEAEAAADAESAARAASLTAPTAAAVAAAVAAASPAVAAAVAAAVAGVQPMSAGEMNTLKVALTLVHELDAEHLLLLQHAIQHSIKQKTKTSAL